VLSFPGVAAQRAARLRELADLGCAVTIERPLGEGGEVCIIERHGRRVTGRGATADESAIEALARWEDPEA
jgi:hypothetical protein